MTTDDQEADDVSSADLGPETELPVLEIPQKVDLGRRFANWRTVASFAFALIILIIALDKSGVNLTDLKTALSKVNPFIFISAFIVYYLSFPLRTIRWRILMRNANTGE